MKVLFCGDAVISSGFARCTHAACDALVSAGHQVVVLGINYFGDPHPYPYSIMPCSNPIDHGYDGMGISRLPRICSRLKPDMIVLLNDPWNIQSYLQSLDDYKEKVDPDFCNPPIIAWLAVDSTNQHAKHLNRLSHVVVWTEFAREELRNGGYDSSCSVVPLGVDTSLFYLVDHKSSRAARSDIRLYPNKPFQISDSDFVVGVVGRNQPRKRLDLTIEYFAEWVRSYSVADAYLYMHVGPTGDIGFNLVSLIKYYGLLNRVIIANPEIGYGTSPQLMRALYSSFDVHLCTSQAEGWHLPTLEAMACGVPCIVPNYAGLGSWVGDAALKVHCSSHAVTAPLDGLAYTIGGVPDKGGVINALNRLYRERSTSVLRRGLRERGLALASKLTWSSTGELFLQALEFALNSAKLKNSGNRVDDLVGVPA